MEKFTFPKITSAFFISLFILALSFLVLDIDFFNVYPHKNNIFSEAISTVIIPHHDLADLQRRQTLSQVATKISPKTILLVSPNHFNTGGFNILSTRRIWKLQNAIFKPDTYKLDKLNIAIDDAAFDREHGIKNLLDPLRNAFPDAKIIPIIIKSNTSAKELDHLSESLVKTCKSCLMVNSVDFSHYQPASIASIHDLYSIEALSNLDDKQVWQSEVDSAASLYLAINWAKAHGTESFHLEYNNNSGLIESSPDAESTSYIFGWYEIGKQTIENSTTFITGYDLEKIPDNRLVSGIDVKIDLNNSHEMGVLCKENPEFCDLNRFFWGPNFYRDILNGLVITGEITPTNYKLVLTPLDTQTKIPLRGEAKLAIINQIRSRLNLPAMQIGPGYDIISITR